MLNTIRRHSLTLAIFAALTTGVTAVVYQLTAPTISQQAMLQKRMLLDQVVSPELYDNDLLGECYIVSDIALGNNAQHRLYLARKNGQPVAVAIESTAPDGYSGAIQMLIGADFDGQVLGVRITEHHETPGLGDKIETRISGWINAFTGQRVENENDTRWAVRKEGGVFDQFTGATITPRAVVNAVKQTVLYVKIQDLTTLPRCEVTQ